MISNSSLHPLYGRHLCRPDIQQRLAQSIRRSGTEPDDTAARSKTDRDPTMRCRANIFIALMLSTLSILIAAPPAVRFINRSWTHLSLCRAWGRRNSPSSTTENTPVAWIKSTAWGLDQPVLHKSHPSALEAAPVLQNGTKHAGSAVIMAHRDRHFRCLKNAARGDTVGLEWRNGSSILYTVSSINIVDKSAAELRISQGYAPGRVALLTCYPMNVIGPAPERLIVWLDPIDFSNSITYTLGELINGEENERERDKL